MMLEWGGQLFNWYSVFLLFLCAIPSLIQFIVWLVKQLPPREVCYLCVECKQKMLNQYPTDRADNWWDANTPDLVTPHYAGEDNAGFRMAVHLEQER